MHLNKLFFLPLFLISASIFAGQDYRNYPTPPDYDPPPYQELQQQDDYDDSEKENTKLADEAPVPKTKKKKEKQTVSCSTSKKVRITAAVMILLASVGGMVSDSITINHSLVPVTRTAQPYGEHWNVTNYWCDTAVVDCTPQENEQFQQMCDRFNVTPARKKRLDPIWHGHKKKGEIPKQYGSVVCNQCTKKSSTNCGDCHYQLHSKPKDCTQTCDIVKDPQKCTKAATEDGRVVFKECTGNANFEVGGPLVKDTTAFKTGIVSVVTRSITTLGTLIVLFAECTG